MYVHLEESGTPIEVVVIPDAGGPGGYLGFTVLVRFDTDAEELNAWFAREQFAREFATKIADPYGATVTIAKSEINDMDAKEYMDKECAYCPVLRFVQHQRRRS